MSEIKFKGWLPGISKMTYTHTLDELMNWNTKSEDNGTAKWLRYTGLFDSEETEVCEGDILHISDRYEAQVVEYDEKTACYGTDEFALFELKRDKGRTFKVIGNIYENPELLKEREGK